MRFWLGVMLLALQSSISAWQISGKVTDIHGKPLSEAQVCIAGSASQCVSAKANGTFVINEMAVGLRQGTTERRGNQPFGLASKGGKLFINSSVNGIARIGWFDAAGRRLGGASRFILTRGINRLGAPPSFPGVVFLQISFSAVCQTWKIASSCIGNRGSTASSQNTLGKFSADAPVITAGKTGYTSRNYYATNATLDTLAWILLAPVDDDTTYKLGGTSYPLCAIPPNQLINTSPYDGCPMIAYSGKKVRGLRVGNTSAIYNNVFAPKDSTFTVIFSYECAGNDAHSDCSQKPGAGTTACRPIQFKINNQPFSKVLWTACVANPDWCHDLFDSIPLPLKAGLNKIETYSSISDMPDMDRIIVKDGRVY